MKNRSVQLLKTGICIVLMIGLTGCWSLHELNTMAIVIGVGLDKGEGNGKTEMTVQISKPTAAGDSKKQGGGAGENAYLNIENSGDTFSSAFSQFTGNSIRKLYFPHNQVVIFGRALAKEGVQKYVDFFMREHENRLTVQVLVAKNKAGEILKVKPRIEKIPATDIADLLRNQSANSESAQVDMKQFMTRLMSTTAAPVAPFIEISGEGEDKKTVISGLAVFKKDKLAGELDRTETRGLLWCLGRVNGGIIEVDCPGGDGKASLEISRSSSKIIPEIKDNRISIHVMIKEEGNFFSQSCSENLTSPPAVDLLDKEKSNVIRGEVMAALKKARELDADIFGFGEAMYKRYPKQWKSIEGRWDELFPNLNVEVQVEAHIQRPGTIFKPANPKKE